MRDVSVIVSGRKDVNEPISTSTGENVLALIGNEGRIVKTHNFLIMSFDFLQFCAGFFVIDSDKSIEISSSNMLTVRTNT